MFDAAEGHDGHAEMVVNEVVDREQPTAGENSCLVATAIAAVADGISTGRHDEGGVDERIIATATRWIKWMESVEHGRQPSIEDRLYRDHALSQLQRLSGQSDAQAWAQQAAGWDRIGFRYDKAYA